MRGLGALLAIGDTVDSMDGSVFSTGGSLSAFQSKISSGVWVALIHASDCGPCRYYKSSSFGPLSAQGMPGVNFTEDESRTYMDGDEVSNHYNVTSFPTTIMFIDGSEVAREEGALGAGRLQPWIQSHMSRSSGAPTVADTIATATTTYSGAEGWGSPPDNTGWKQVFVDGENGKQKYWNKGGASGQFIPAASTTGAAPALVTQTTDTVAATPSPFDHQVPSPLFSAPTPAAAAPTTPAPSVTYSGNVSATLNVSADPNSWSYILQHGNSKWQAVYLTDDSGRNHAFRNKLTGDFKKGETIRGLSGMRLNGLSLAGIAGFLGAVTVSVPTYTTVKGGGSSTLKTVGIVAGSAIGVGLLGYLIYRAVK